MNPALNVLSTQIRERRRATPDSQAARRFLEVCVDGISLYDLSAGDQITGMADMQPQSVSIEYLRRLKLLADADFPENRRSLYVCPECGDLGCGALSVVVSSREELVTWEDFGYENNYEDKVIREGYESLGPFRFSSDQYHSALNEAEQGSKLLSTEVTLESRRGLHGILRRLATRIRR